MATCAPPVMQQRNAAQRKVWYNTSMDIKTILRAKKAELEDLASEKGVSAAGTREEIIERLISEEVETSGVAQPDDSPVLVRYNRKNSSFTAEGYTFSQKNPFVVVPRAVADHLFATFEGFFPATPNEVQEFYNK